MTFAAFRTTTALALLAATPALADVYHITSDADSGEGSLRAALEAAASAEAPVQIAVAVPGTIALESGLVYAGTQPLIMVGQGTELSLSVDETVFTASQGADLSITGMTFSGPGGFSIEARGDADGTAGKGIFVDVRDDQEGTVNLVLSDVTVRGVANHGIHVSDCSLADDCGGGSGGDGEGSEASISLVLDGVTVIDAGNGKFDADGVRVDERDAGDIRFVSFESTFEGVGADGVELDEGQDGSVYVQSQGDVYISNGLYCDPDLLESFLPDPDEGEFDEGAMAEDAVPPAVEGSPDDSCIEREVDLYDDGSVEEFAFGLDLDDGFDVDEAGPGSIVAKLDGTEITNNFDEGLDYDEEDAGGIALVLLSFNATGNTDDGVKMSEEGEGSVEALVLGGRAEVNGGVGYVFEEADGGDVTVMMDEVSSAGNDDGDLGLEVVQEDEGTGSATLMGTSIEDGVEVEGVDLNEM